MIEFIYAFILGLMSIISPCTFILVPAMLTKIKSKPYEILLFLAGLVTTFTLLGVVTVLTGRLLTSVFGRYVYLISGAVTLLMALSLIGIFKPEIPSLFSSLKSNYLNGLFYGGCTLTCIGPFLGAILAFVVTKASVFYGFLIMLIYSVGFISPFFVFGAIITDSSIQEKITRHSELIRKISSIMLISTSFFLIAYGMEIIK